MFCKLGTEISSEVELLVTKSCTKAFHLDRTIGCDPELIIRLGESDGSVGHECFLHERKHTRSILYDPTKARRPRTFLGGSQEAKAATRWGEARIEPWDHIQPRMVVEAGQIMVLAGERRRSQRSRAVSTFR